MFGSEFSEDQRPVTYFRGHPIHAATLLVIIHVVAALVAVFAGPAFGTLAAWLGFRSSAVWSGAVWQVATYALVHDPRALLWFAIEMFLLFQFGRELEKFFGRREFLKLYAILLGLTPLVLLVLSFVTGPTAYFGSNGLHFAIFIAFATLYPDAAMLFGITARWVAIVLVAISSLQALAVRSATDLVVLWASVGAAWAFVRHARGELGLPSVRWPSWRRRKTPNLRVVRRDDPPAVRRPASVRVVPEDAAQQEMDALLDKIARSGLASLSAAERERLERAREALLRKGR